MNNSKATNLARITLFATCGLFLIYTTIHFSWFLLNVESNFDWLSRVSVFAIYIVGVTAAADGCAQWVRPLSQWIERKF